MEDTSPDYILIIILIIYISILLFRCFVQYALRNENDNNPEIVERIPERQQELQGILRRNINVIILTNDNDMDIMYEEDDIENKILKCPICQDILNDHIIKTECNHRYHKPCLLSWIGSGQRQCLKCPMCLQSLSL